MCKLKLTTELELTRKSRNQFEDKYLGYANFPEITDEELKLFQETWPMWNIEKKDLTWARVYKREWGFSPYERALDWFLGFGSRVQVLGPEDFKALYVKELEKMLGMYRGNV